MKLPTRLKYARGILARDKIIQEAFSVVQLIAYVCLSTDDKGKNGLKE
jgi:hypothetical protein